jgi:hypothetical protein
VAGFAETAVHSEGSSKVPGWPKAAKAIGTFWLPSAIALGAAPYTAAKARTSALTPVVETDQVKVQTTYAKKLIFGGLKIYKRVRISLLSGSER